MSHSILSTWCLLTFLVVGANAAEPPRPDRDSPPAVPLAHRAWVTTEAVLENHIDPPTRQGMLLAGLKGLFAEAHHPAPLDLSRRLSQLTTEESFAALLQEIWPRGNTPTKELEKALVNALLESVPGSPTLLRADELKVQEQVSHNRYVGIGIQIRMDPKEDLTQIVVPIAGGPARRAGAKPGDMILEVDGMSMKGFTLPQVVERLRGEEGTPVTLLVRQPGASTPRTLQLIRTVVPFEMVVGYQRVGEETWEYRVDPELPIAYLRVNSLTSSTAHELRKVEPLLLSKGIRGLVLDLRLCSGGELRHAQLVADELLDGGVLWEIRDARGRVKEVRANRDCLFRDCPLVVLVGRTMQGTTTGLVAAALQEHRHALLVGEPTEGDPWITTLVQLPEKIGTVGLRTGVAEHKGKSVPAPGGQALRGETSLWHVQPDQVVVLENKQRDRLWEWHHKQGSPEPLGANEKPPEDPQLAKAMAILRDLLKKEDQGQTKK